MTRTTLAALLLAAPLAAGAAPAEVRVVSDASGQRLTVDGKDFMVLGMNWDYFPIGTNYNYDFWSQPDAFIEAALANEMTPMKRMGVNAIRVYVGIPQRWIRYIHERYGIWTVLNHTVGRYGYNLDGKWIGNTDYSNPRFREVVKAEIGALVDAYRDTPGLLMWLLGNENNYGLVWSSFEIEALPKGEREAAKAKHLYSLFGEIVREVKARDPHHPVSMANGDLQYIDLIAQEVKGLDVMGVNVYRGASVGDLFQVVKEKLGVPVMFTEFGSDAFDAKLGREDDLTQARYLLAQWREIFEQSSGKGKAGNAIGGLTFQWSDGWWKYKQETNLEVHDTNASWPNGGYKEDYVEGDNNMNEEWWGICAKGQPDARGLYPLRPRTAYYVLQQAFRLPAYGGTDLAAVGRHFGAIEPDELAYHYKADKAAGDADWLSRVRLSNVYMKFETYSTGGNDNWQRSDLPPGVAKGFDTLQSFFVAAEVNPTDKVRAVVNVNVLGNVPLNPIDEIFYENRGKPITVRLPDDPATQEAVEDTIQGIERVKVYKASVSWHADYLDLEGFYRTGHYHWASEGDLFNLYREANYGGNVDVYNADAPVGVEFTGKRALEGLKLAFGPQLWWGANPTLLAKYRLPLGPVTATLLHQEDLDQAGLVGGISSTIPQRQTRKTTLALETRRGSVGLELAGIIAGRNQIGTLFLDEEGNTDQVISSDTFGAKARATLEAGRFHGYAQGAYMGLVAESGSEQRVTYTGWSLKDSGSGNQVNALAGFAVDLGRFRVGPNFLWQKPLVGPGPSLGSLPDQDRSRNIAEDPFVVRPNRETVAGELLVAYDPTPATWMWAWDNDLREDAKLAASVDVSFRHMPTGIDATFWYDAKGNVFAWSRGVPAADVWDVTARFVSALRPDTRLALRLYGGNPQANGQDPRQPNRYGGDLRVSWRSLLFQGFAKFNDWGTYDYYRDFNSTLPLQLMGDVSFFLGSPSKFWLWLDQTRLGLAVKSRWLNGYSGARYKPDPQDSSAWGHEYEIRTYLTVSM
jgi:hypothetical protein